MGSKAFTLLEMLVVILLIAILASVALPQYETARDKAALSAIMPLTRSIKNAQEEYFLVHGEYSDNWYDLTLGDPPQEAVISQCNLGGHETQCLSTPDWRCNLITNAGYVFCVLNNPKVAYGLRVDNKTSSIETYTKVYCRAGDDRGKKVCISLGGKTTGMYDGWEEFKVL